MGKVREIDSEEDLESVMETVGTKLVVVDFWASWCGPCRMIGPHYHKIAEEAVFKDVVFLSVDVDEVCELAEKYDIQVMPTFIFFRNGKKVDEMSGANKEKLRELIEKNI